MSEMSKDERAAFLAQLDRDSKRAFLAGPEHVTPDELIQAVKLRAGIEEIAKSKGLQLNAD